MWWHVTLLTVCVCVCVGRESVFEHNVHTHTHTHGWQVLSSANTSRAHMTATKREKGESEGVKLWCMLTHFAHTLKHTHMSGFAMTALERAKTRKKKYDTNNCHHRAPREYNTGCHSVWTSSSSASLRTHVTFYKEQNATLWWESSGRYQRF